MGGRARGDIAKAQVNAECAAGTCGLKRAFDAPAGAASKGVQSSRQNTAVLGDVSRIRCFGAMQPVGATSSSRRLRQPAAARSTPRMGDDSQRTALRNVTFTMKYKHQQAVSNATISSHCFKRQDSLAEQRPPGCYFVLHSLSRQSDVEVSKFSLGSVKRSHSDSIEISLSRPHTGPGSRWTMHKLLR